MKIKFNINLASIVFIIAISGFVASCNNKSDNTEGSYSDASLPTESLCETDWVPHNQTPPPEEGNGSPFDTTSTTNSIFHQWSWQKFLWLTKPMENGKPLFEDSLTLVDNQLIPVNPIDDVSLVLTDIGQAGSKGILMSNADLNGKSDSLHF